MNEGCIIGLGGAGFPTHSKYETKERIKYILINAAECEPYLTCDHMLIMEHGYAVINGVLLLVKASGADKAIICLRIISRMQQSIWKALFQIRAADRDKDSSDQISTGWRASTG